jgi:formylglycine-generating enzyme required for sulfatase activity
MPPRTFGPLGTTRYAVNGVPFDTVRVPPGRFVDGEGVEKRELLISRPFELGTTLVTQALWRAVTGESPSYFRGDDRPVERVSWDDVQTFLGRLELLGLQGFRLPAEAEWAWAARCGVSTRWAGADRAKVVAVVDKVRAEPVGGLLPSAAGALDLSGNMMEWQQDWWSRPPVAGVDADGPASGYDRVWRGGSWEDAPGFVRLVYRSSFSSDSLAAYLGLRLARTAP